MNMRRTFAGNLQIGLAAAVAGAFCVSTALGQWIELNKENARLAADNSVGLGDTQERDYEWGDVNNNGWVDLIAMRKQPFTSAGKRRNVLFMNEGGVLVDRTQEYASAADQSQIVTSPGWTAWNGTNGGVNYGTHPDYFPDKGFLSPTNDRASVLFDMNNNGWLDLATAVTLNDGDPKHIGHPRVYANLANDGSGNWQGFQFENARVPAMLSWSGQSGRNPRFCSVDAGDITGDGYADLYFGDYDSSGAGGLNQPAGADFNDKLLINEGASNPGYFSDETSQRFSGNISGSGVNQQYPVSAFGTAVVIADINKNGRNDIIKSTGLNAPTYVGAAYNNNAINPGNFTSGMYQVVQTAAPYFVRMGDLNNNGRLDVVITDDNADRYRLNNSTSGTGLVNWSSTTFLPEWSNGLSGTGFGSNIVIADLNNNGWNDILIADVDVDIGGCNRYMNIYRNNANGPNVTFANGSTALSLAERQGTFDIAVFDLTGNGWLDIVQGRCSGTSIWVQVPPFDLEFDYPNGLPSVVDIDVATPVTVQLSPTGGSIVADSVILHTSVEDGAWQQTTMTHQGGNVYTADLPALECLENVAWYFSAELQSTTFTDPPNAPASTFTAIAADDTAPTTVQDFDSGDGGFTVSNDPSLTQGAWQHGVPAGSTFFGQDAAPFGDSTGAMAWATCLGGTAGTCNVAFGPTHLISPAFDLSTGPATIVYDRWVFCHNAHLPEREDFLKTYVSNDGGANWVFVHETSGTAGQWETASFAVNDYVTPTDNVKVRFSVADTGNDSITNAGIDNLRIEEFVCDTPGTPCPADLTGDGNVGVADLLDLLAAWGPNPGHAADLTGDGNVGVADLLDLLAAWGTCPK